MGTLVESADEDDIVGSLCQCYRIVNKLLLTAAVAQVLTSDHTIILPSDIAYIAALIDHLCHTLKRARMPSKGGVSCCTFKEELPPPTVIILTAFSPITAIRRAFTMGRTFFVVLQQYDALCAYPAGSGKVLGRSQCPVRPLTIHRRAELQPQDATHLVVEFLRPNLAFLDQFQVCWARKYLS